MKSSKADQGQLITIQKYQTYSGYESRNIASGDDEERSVLVRPKPDRATRSIRLEPQDGKSVMRGAAKGLQWPSGNIADVKIELVLTDQRIAFAIPRCPKPSALQPMLTLKYMPFEPFEWLFRYAAESRRYNTQIGLGQLHYDWITAVGSAHQMRGRRRRPGRQKNGDILRIGFDPVVDAGGEIHESGSGSADVHVELAPDLSGEMLALELTARVCRHRLAALESSDTDNGVAETIASTLKEVEERIASFTMGVSNPNLSYEITR
ncbi:MAG: hypothetical protein OXG55_09625 [bacterium]|nr:hypothetical protein [bacterium]